MAKIRQLKDKDGSPFFPRTVADAIIMPDESSMLSDELDKKVDKVAGKELSANDFTDTLKTKLDNIEESANNYILPSDVVHDAAYMHTDNNFTNGEKTLLSHQSGYNTGDQNIAAMTHTNRSSLDLVSGTNTGDQYIPTNLNEFDDDSEHRIVTDVEKAYWNEKQPAGVYSTDIHDNISSLDNVSGTNTGDETKERIISLLEYTPENPINKGQNNGYVGLDNGGKIDVAHLPSSIMQYKQTWNPNTNTPMLTALDITKAGYVYIVNTEIPVTLFGYEWKNGDWVVYSDEGVLEWSPNSDEVTSVNNQKGAVLLDADDISDTDTSHKFTNSTDIARLDTFLKSSFEIVEDPLLRDADTLSGKTATSSLGLDDSTLPTSKAVRDYFPFVVLTQVEYDALVAPIHGTFYLVGG